MRTPICTRLDVDLPIFAFSHCRDVVAAVSRAGGYGVLGALAYTPEQLEVELSWIDEHCGGRPYGVDIVMPNSYVGKGGGQAAELDSLEAMIPAQHWAFADALLAEHGVPPLPPDQRRAPKAPGLGVDAEAMGQVEVALAHNASMVVNALGPPPPAVIDLAHQRGLLVGALVGSRRHAQKQVDQGVDVIVAQGYEAGGHTGEITSMVLTPEIVDAVGDRVPVLAAGGIATGRQLAAALALGAQGAWTGSMWLTVAEADTNPASLDNLLRAGSSDTVRSRSMTGKPARLLTTAWTEAWEGPDSPGVLAMPLQGILYDYAFRRLLRTPVPELSGYPVGQIVGRLNEVRPVKEVIATMVDEWIATTERLASLLEE